MLMKSNESVAIFFRMRQHARRRYGRYIKDANVGSGDKTFPSNRGVDPNILNSFHPSHRKAEGVTPANR